VINGGFGPENWQRGTAFASDGYTADRWNAVGITSVQQSSVVPTGEGFLYSLEFANSGAVASLIRQRIERQMILDLVGKPVTVSFWAKNEAGSGALSVSLVSADAADNFSNTTPRHSDTLAASPSGLWTQYSYSVSALDSNFANGLELRIQRAGDNAHTTRVTGVQLEPGALVTPFEFRNPLEELVRCKRYYQRLGYGAQGNATAADTIWVGAPILPAMRATPTFALAGVTMEVRIEGAGTVSAASPAIADQGPGPDGWWARISGFSGLTTGQGAFVRTTGWGSLSAEL
jgi:hypothetical protein